jgi:hypothetical protein
MKKREGTPMRDTRKRLAGVIGFFDEPGKLIEATKKVRDAKYLSFDTYTPYPVHGLEHAQGLGRSPVPLITFIAGLTGVSCAFLLEYWTSAVDWPLIVGGKPFNSWPAFVPIMFELTVLFAGLCTVGAMFAFNKLPNVTKKSFDPSLTRNRFAIVIDAPDPIDEEDDQAVLKRKKKMAGRKAFEETEAQAFLKSTGASDIRSVYVEGWF